MMRLVCVFLAARLLAADDLSPARTPVLIAVQAEAPLAAPAMDELQSELSRLFGNTAHEIRVQPLDAAQPADGFDLVHLRLRGDCRLRLEPYLLDERGPYAITHVSDGRPLPFAEVDCRRVRQAVRTALHGGQMRQSDVYIGRALARIIGHELWHMITGRRDHSSHGVAKEKLRPSELVAEQMRFAPNDEALLKWSSPPAAGRSPAKPSDGSPSGRPGE